MQGTTGNTMTHVRRRVFYGAALLGAAGAWSSNEANHAAAAQQERFVAMLTGPGERPQAVTTNAVGTAEVTFDATGPITYRLHVMNMSSAVLGAHIHGPADSNATGGVMATL